MTIKKKWLVQLFFVPFDSFVSLRLSAPFSFSLCFYKSSAVVMLRFFFCSIFTYVPVKSGVVHLILLKSLNVLV